eukprot:1179465-Prorocentrum_minimum.AAC.5
MARAADTTYVYDYLGLIEKHLVQQQCFTRDGQPNMCVQGKPLLQADELILVQMPDGGHAFELDTGSNHMEREGVFLGRGPMARGEGRVY